MAITDIEGAMIKVLRKVNQQDRYPNKNHGTNPELVTAVKKSKEITPNKRFSARVALAVFNGEVESVSKPVSQAQPGVMNSRVASIF